MEKTGNPDHRFADDKSMSIIGVIGGIGPYAGLDFAKKIFASTRAVKDQDHLNCMVSSLPSLIPDRTEFLLQGKNEEENPAFGIFESARRLHLAGVRIVAVACNTAHAGRIFNPLCAMVKESLPDLKIVNMLEACADYVKESLQVNCLGLLATMGTHNSRVYHEYFRQEDGFQLIEPDPEGQGKVHDAIYNKNFGIKAFSDRIKPLAKTLIANEISKLIERGAKAIILGCTELPLAADPEDFPLQLIDPGLIVARRLITLSAPEKLLPL
jgi:aspartate racemase